MRHLLTSVFAVGLTVSLSSVSLKAEDAKVTVEKIDPSKSIADILKDHRDDDCVIIIQDGKPYRVCPFKVPFELQNSIRAQENK